MIEAFIRGDNGPSRERLAASPSLVHSRHPELRSVWARFASPTEAYEHGSRVPKPRRSVAHVAYWKEESEAE